MYMYRHFLTSRTGRKIWKGKGVQGDLWMFVTSFSSFQMHIPLVKLFVDIGDRVVTVW